MGTLGNVAAEIARARQLAADRGSLARWSADILTYRLLRLVSIPGRDRRRTIILKGGTRLTYRLNRGDVLTLREVWIDEVYRVPGLRKAGTLVDLGANIGLASVWFAARYGCDRLVAVEVLPANAALLRQNLRQNGIVAEVLECAVGAGEGEGFIRLAEEPNSARLAQEGQPVLTVAMSEVVGALDPPATVDVLKVDIEGAEETLFSGDLGWLEGVQAIVVEIHGWASDRTRLVARIEAAGFRVLSPWEGGDENVVVSFARP